MKRTFGGIIRLGLLVIVGGFLVIQIIPYGHNHANPPVVSEPTWDSAQTRALAKRACFDCHSNESTWPWYSNIAPVSWLIQRDVDEGRSSLNFSEWGGSGNRRLREISRVVLEGQMPPAIYLLQHPNAKLTDAEIQQLANGLSATVNASR
ncbi:MAG TPA: heme-binding domain-containing protein [Anaerolineales bacterium]